MNGKQIIKEVARKNGVSVGEVRRGILACIEAAAANPDPRARAAFEAIPRRGALPTPEEFIAHTARQARVRMLGLGR